MNPPYYTKDQQIESQKAEIARLKSEMTSAIAVMAAMGITIEGKNVLITELNNALQHMSNTGRGGEYNHIELNRRALEAAK